MEIERKFLIKENKKTYSSPLEIIKLEKLIEKKGKKVIQSYLSLKKITEILKEQKCKIDFEPNELRIRQIKNKFFLTLKSKGKLKREEFEKRIKKRHYEKYFKLREKTLEKIRFEKRIKRKLFFFDYYPKQKLITMEIEFKTKKEAKKFVFDGKEITKSKKYRNKNLAKSTQNHLINKV